MIAQLRDQIDHIWNLTGRIEENLRRYPERYDLSEMWANLALLRAEARRMDGVRTALATGQPPHHEAELNPKEVQHILNQVTRTL